MFRSIMTKVGMMLLSGLVVLGVINTAFYPETTFATSEETREAYTRISYTDTPETFTLKNDAVTIDLSNARFGYLAAKYTGDNEKVKVIISIDGKNVIYDIPVDKYDEYIILPFHAGNGDYEITVWESMGGMMYKSVLDETETIDMYDEALPFLYSSLNVQFDDENLAVIKAAEIALFADSEKGFVNDVFYWVTAEIEYDYDLEDAIKAGMRYATDIDKVMVSKKGICLDYATVMVAMLRSQGVPAKVVVGLAVYEGEVLFPKHSWVSVYLKDQNGGYWVDYDPTFNTTKAEGAISSDFDCGYIPEYCY